MKEISQDIRTSTNEPIVLVYDTDLRRPACVLLQAAYGCYSGALQQLFDPNTWLLAPTPGMRKLSATKEQWCKVAALPPIATAPKS